MGIMLSLCLAVEEKNIYKQVYIGEKQIYQEEQVEEKAICGEEDTKPVENYILSPMIHQSIGGFHFINLNKDPSAGSGVLLSKNLVLTAAHNLYDKESQQELDKQTYRFYYQAENGIAIRFYKVANWKYLKQFTTCKKNTFKLDYALVKLEESVDLPSFPPLTLPCQVCLDSKKQQLGIFGYPILGENYQSGSQQWQIHFIQYGLNKKKKITFFKPQEQLINYGISTQKGHSGSPVIFDEKIIAVHVGTGRKNFNIGKLVTKNLLHNLTSWADQLRGERFVTSHCEHIKKREQLLEQAQKISGKGMAKIYQKDYFSARNYFSQCLQIQIQAVGKEGRETANTLFYIGRMYFQQNNYSEATKAYKQYISIREKYSQERVDGRYCYALTNLGNSYQSISDFKSGVEYFEQRLLHNQQIQYQDGAKCCAKWLVEYSKISGGSQRAEELKQKYKIRS